LLDTPAWVVAAANQYAIDNGKTPFCVYQGRWNVMIRDFERDMCGLVSSSLYQGYVRARSDLLPLPLCSIPMCRQFGMALAPWDAIGSGKLLTQKQLDERKKAGEKFRSGGHERTETEIKYAECLAGIAAEHGIESVTAVALACAFTSRPFFHPRSRLTPVRARRPYGQDALCLPYCRWPQGRGAPTAPALSPCPLPRH